MLILCIYWIVHHKITEKSMRSHTKYFYIITMLEIHLVDAILNLTELGKSSVLPYILGVFTVFLGSIFTCHFLCRCRPGRWWTVQPWEGSWTRGRLLQITRREEKLGRLADKQQQNPKRTRNDFWRVVYRKTLASLSFAIVLICLTKYELNFVVLKTFLGWIFKSGESQNS